MDRVARQAGASPARKRKREREGRCEGPKPLSETRPEVVALARKLRRRRPKGGQLSLREVAKELAARGSTSVASPTPQSLLPACCGQPLLGAGYAGLVLHSEEKSRVTGPIRPPRG